MKKEFVEINYLDAENAVVLEWKTTPTPAEFKEGLNAGLEMVKETKAEHWIGDVREMGAIGPEEQEWSNKTWFPQALGAGIKKMAVVVSDDIFNQLSVEEIMSKVESLNFVSQFFDNTDNAKKWLRN